MSNYICFVSFAEARRLGKTVIIAKNIKSKARNSSTEEAESCSDEESDDSMDGHPVKKKKIN